jgi:NAD(P)-dependent dehydrogenase (short-subunit alcohol dehydrogenase family)
LDVNRISDDSEAGLALLSEPLNRSVTILKCDISSWEEQLSAFQDIHRTEGRIDIVLANAGVSERSSLIEDIEDCPTKPDLRTLDINLVGLIYSELVSDEI